MKIVFSLLFAIMASLSFAQDRNNVNKGEFDINDPRNPDCPCHKMQQQAEQEFAQGNNLNAFFDNIGNGLNENPQDHSNVQPVNSGKVRERSFAGSAVTHKRKRKVSGLQKQLFRTMNKHKIRKRVKPNYAVCYKW